MFTDNTSIFVQDRLLTNLINKRNADLQNIDGYLSLSSNKLSENIETINYIIFETNLENKNLISYIQD